MAKDTFKRTAPTIEFFRDGETIRAKKLGKMIEKIQDGMASLESAVGDIHNRSVTFDINPLFQNSVARSMGAMDQLSFVPYRKFAIIEKTKQSLHQGLIKWPHSNVAATIAGNLSANLLPMVRQEDKVGIGCTRDDGNQCTAGYQNLYDQEKNLVPNGQLREELALSGLDVIDATIKVGGGAQMDVAYRYNFFAYSENFENWSQLGTTTMVQRDPLPDPNGQNAAYKITPQIDADAFTSIQSEGVGSTSSQDWCFAVWMATSGERDIYLTISGAVTTNLLSGCLDGAPFTIYKPYPTYHSYFGLHLSGLEWKRYWVHASYGAPVAPSSLLCQVILGISGRVDTTPVFLFGGQLEPTNFPTEYRRTQGSATSGLGTEVSVGYNLSVIPGHTYQVTLAGSGTIRARLDGQTLFTLPTKTTTFVAEADTVAIDAYVSGAAASSNFLTLLRVDPGTPCHAMNCPGLSAYEKTRSYRAVLPALTVSGHQYFAQRLQLPDEFQQALTTELPGNILGVFDHELNHAVPDQIVDWKLTNWPIGGYSLGGLIVDPNFMTDWTTAGANTYPSELIPTTGSGVVTRDIAVSNIVSTDTLPPDPAPHLLFIGSVAGRTGTLSPPGDPGPAINAGIPAITMETWVKVQSSGATPIFKLMGTNSGSSSATPGKTIVSGGLIRHAIYSSYYSMNSTYNWGTTDIRDDRWHHVAMVQTNNGAAYTSKIYVDGVLDSTNTTNTAFYAYASTELPTAHINVGNDVDLGVTTVSGIRMAGLLVRGLAAYTGNFTPSPGAFFPSGLTNNDLSGIILYWPMTEGTGQTLYDAGPSGYNGYLGAGVTVGADDPTWVVSGSRVYVESNPDYPSSAGYGFGTDKTNGSEVGFYGLNQTFTIEAWLRVGNGITSGIGNGPILGRGYTATQSILYYYNYIIGMRNGCYYGLISKYNGANAGIATGAGGHAFGTQVAYIELNNQISDDGLWHHVAFTATKNSGLYNPCKLFVDGVLQASGHSEFQTEWDWRMPSDTYVAYIPTEQTFSLGCGDPPLPAQVAFDCVIISSGLKYTSNFTPPQNILKNASFPEIAHLNVNEAGGSTIYNSSPTFQHPLRLVNSAGYPYAGNNLSDIVSSAWRWRSDNFYTTVTPSGTPVDRVTVAVSGNDWKGLTHTYPLSVGQVYTLDYKVRAALNYSGIFERFVVPSGTVEVDLLLDSNYQAIDASGLNNFYKVSDTEPGTTNWSDEVPGGFWEIRRRIRATEDGTLLTITVGVSGNASAQTATFDSLDVTVQTSNSTIFKYQDDPVLGLNWEGSAAHVIEENLWTWSENLSFAVYDDNATQFEFRTPDPSGVPGATVIRGYGLTTEFDDMSWFLDGTLTLQFWARSNSATATTALAHVGLFTDTFNETQEYTVTGEWRQFSFMFSGIDMLNATYHQWEIANPDPGGEQEIAWICLHHGSGIVPYEKTYGRPIRRYRHALRVDQYKQLGAWDNLYGLTNGLPIQTNLIADSFSGLMFESDITQADFRNFPTSGVIRVLGQEFAYRGKTSAGKFIDCVPKWRGTSLNDTLLVSGSRVTYVPLPVAVDRIETDLVWLKEPLPAANGDWAANIHLQLYNTQVSNLGRYSLTASAISLTRAAGTLMTAFMSHVSDDARHFRRDQLCAAILDPSTQAGFDDLEVRLEMVGASIQEINQPGLLNIFAYGFMDSNPKLVTISWGDGTTTSGTMTGQYFDAMEHTYDLGAYNRPLQHTINVEVRDLNLSVTRSNTISVVVTPVTKGSQRVRAVIITQPTATSQARTAIWAQTSGLLQARTYLL